MPITAKSIKRQNEVIDECFIQVTILIYIQRYDIFRIFAKALMPYVV